MFMSGIFIMTAVWAWKATKGWQEKSLLIACSVAFLLLTRIVPLLLPENAGLVVTLAMGIASIWAMISLGGRFRSQRMREVLEESDEVVPGAQA